MRGPFRIEAYAIASADGMIADETGSMPKSLTLEADQRFLMQALDRADVVAHGRLSQEDQPNSPKRRRLLLTRKVAGLATDPDNANARLWNPARLARGGRARRSDPFGHGTRYSEARTSSVYFLAGAYALLLP